MQRVGAEDRRFREHMAVHGMEGVAGGEARR
jgi:hypothetical protein